MKFAASIFVVTLIAGLLAACGEAGAGSEPSPTPDHRIIALDRPASTVSSNPAPTLEPTKTKAPAQAPPSPTPSSVATHVPEPAATPVITENGQVIDRVWSVALVTAMDLPDHVAWTREWLDTPEEQAASPCGVPSPVIVEASVGVSFTGESWPIYFEQTIIEYVSSERAQQALHEVQAFIVALADCEIASDDPEPELNVQQRMELVPLDLPPISDDRIGFRATFSFTGDEFQETLHADWITVQADRFLVFFGFGDWESELGAVDISLIERALQRLDIARTEPPATSATVIPELEVSTIVTCDQAAEEILHRLQVQVDLVAPVPLDQLTIVDEHPDADRLKDDLNSIEAHAREIGCENAEIGTLVVDGLDGLKIAGPSALFFTDLLRAKYLGY